MATASRSSSEDAAPVDLEKQGQEPTVPMGRTQSGVSGGRIEPDEYAPPAVEDAGQAGTEPEYLSSDAEGVAGAVSRVLSRISTKSSWNPGPPPDGGKEAWLICFCAHLMVMNTWGLINSFGVFQPYYEELLGRPASDVSWIGSIQVFLTFFGGTLSGRYTDAGFLRPILLVGSAFIMLGIFATSAATQYWQLVLSQGVCLGVGNAFLFCPSISVNSTYFSSRRAFAIALAASGTVSGGLVFPAMARQLLPAVGFGWTMRAIGFVQLATLIFANIFLKSRLPPRRSGSLVEWGAFGELEYTFYAIGMFFNFWGLYFTFYYLAAFSRTAVSPAFSATDSLNLLLVLNGVGLLGRLLPNYVADRLGPLNMLAPAAVTTGACLLAWMAVGSPAGLYAWGAFYGLSAGAIQSLFPAGLSSLTDDVRKQGTRMGMCFTIVSFAVLTGNPIAGGIIGAQGGSYVGAQGFTGACMMVGAGFILAARQVRMRKMGLGWKAKI